MKAAYIISRNLKEITRNKILMGFLLGMPIAFMVIMGAAFGSQHIPRTNVGIIDKDNTDISEIFIEQCLRNITDLKITNYDNEEEACKAIKSGEIVIYIVIPKGFKEQTLRSWSFQSCNITLNLTYDYAEPALAQKGIAIIKNALLEFSKASIPITINSQALQREAEEKGYFQFSACGNIIFGMFILMPTVAAIIAEDRGKGFLARLQTTPTKPFDFALGYFAPLIILSVFQIMIYTGVALLFGLKIYGSIFTAWLIFFVAGMCAVGIGMIIGCFCRRGDEANGLSWVILVPTMMLSGIWFPTTGMHPVMQSLANALPTTYALKAATAVVIRGSALEVVFYEFFVSVVFAIAFFTVGALMFKKNIPK